MRKVFLRAAATLLVLLLFCTVYLQIRQYNSYKNTIHKQANAIIKINTDKIIRSLTVDFLTNPKDWLKPKKKELPKIKNGINIPANIFIYNVSHKLYDTFFCTLELSDSLLFKNFISKKLGIQSFKKINSSTVIGVTKSGKITVAYTADVMAIAFSAKKEKVTDILMEILNGKNMLSDTDQRIGKLKESNDHITYIQNHSYGGLNFTDGEVLLNASIASPAGFIAAEAVQHSQFPKESSIKMWMGANFKPNGKSPIFNINEYTFHLDSLLGYYKGYTEAVLVGSVTQQDSVITYEYNDDFEKVEKKTVASKQVPGMYFSFKSDATALSNYLQNQEAIQPNGLINKNLFPLYTLHASVDSDYLQVSTAKVSSLSTKKEHSDFFFFLSVDFNRLKKEKQFPILNTYIQKLSSLELKAQKKKKMIHLLGSVSFTDKETNAFRQMKSLLGM